MKTDNPHALNLFFTGKCNLDCRYCFVNKTGLENTTLDENSLKKSVDMLFSYPGRKKTISFNGGEPTLEWPLVKKIYNYAKNQAAKKDIILDVAVMTNGTLLNQQMIDYFIKNGTIVKISIDGDKLTHDKNRPFKLNRRASSFDKIIKNINNVKTGNLRIAASMVLTPQSLDKFLENIKFLNSQNFYYIEIYPELYAIWEDTAFKKLKKVFKEFESYYMSLFKDNNEKPFKISLLDTFVNNIEIEKMAKCGKIHIGVTGDFYACDKVFSLSPSEREKYIVGSAKIGVDNEKRAVILNKLRNNFFEKSGLGCKKCGYFRYCFCPLGHHVYFLSKKGVDSRGFWKSFCNISKIYSETFLKIRDSLKYNPNFIKLYKY